MALFGRKANQSSNNGDVPPELKPYYVPGSGTPPSRRSALRVVLSLLILAIVATAGVSIWRYVRDHPKSTNTLATNQTNQKPKTNTNTSNQNSNKNTTNGNSAGTGSQSTLPTTQQLPSDGNSTPSTSSPSSTPSGGAGAGTNQALVNTGPGETTAFIAIITAMCSALLYYIWQIRRANS